MIRALIRPYAVAATAGALALMSACTLKSEEAPALTGPSEFDLSITLSASPDQLQQDGASQSLVTITARDANSQPVHNLSLRAAMSVSGTLMDYGSLSARSLVTGSDGRSNVVYTAPSSPAVSTDEYIVVDIVVTPQGSDYANTTSRVVSIRLYPIGPVIPGKDLEPAFTFDPTSPQENQTVLFDASTSKGSIVSYEWSFGDGERKSGRTVSHDYAVAGTYVVTLTLSDGYGRTASTSKSITVGAGTAPTPAFVFSPTGPAPQQEVFFNASASTGASGRTIVSYQWDFGDGAGGSGKQVSHVFRTVGTYSVTLTVTDDAGRTAVLTQEVEVAVPDAGLSAVSRTPGSPR